jgi:hypothetical protein
MENKELSYLVSEKDLKRKFKANLSQVKVLVYPQLNQVNVITDILPENICCVFILLRTTENSGHWCSLCRHNDNIYYFDSYGVSPDGEMSKIAPNMQYELHENTKSLTRLIRTMPNGFTFAYNKVQFQQYKPYINTCGKWSLVFCKCIFNGLSLNDFQTRMKLLKTQYKQSYDDLICILWDSF